MFTLKARSTFIALGMALLFAGALLFAAKPHTIVQASNATTIQEPQKPVVSRAVNFAESAPVRDLKSQTIPPGKTDTTRVLILGDDEDEQINLIKNPVLPDDRVGGLGKGQIDPALRSTNSDTNVAAAVAAPLPGPIVNFEGINSGENIPFLGGRVLPPDTNGDVGPTQYVQSVNSAFRVFDKAGNPLTPTTYLNALWQPLGGACTTNGGGDPIVLYDNLADRWMISQFTTGAPAFHQCIAVSRTGDATGGYYLYDFNVGSTLFNDYPHIGVWPDGYYMTVNQFAGNSFAGAGAYAFDRAKILRGDPTATLVYFNLGTNFGGMLPSDLDGQNLPPAGRPNTFGMLTTTTTLQLFDFHVDFATPANSTFTERSDSPVTVAAYDFGKPSGRNVIEQPRPATPTPTPPAIPTFYLDAIQDRLMFRLAYRNFGTREALVMNHTVNVSGVTPTTVGTHQAGVRYYELSRNLASGGFSVFNQETFNPDAGNGATGNNRWMGSVAQDNQGNLALGYSVSGVNTFPSIRYTGRAAGTGPLEAETTLINGTGVQRSTSGRWGDYSDMTVDPVDDCTFWFTTEYYTAAGQSASTAQWQTRIGSFRMPQCTAPATGTLNGTVTNCATGLPIANAFVTIADGFSRATLANGTYSAQLPPGTYTVIVSAPGYPNASAPQTVTVTNGGTSTVNACLTGAPILAANGSTLVNESCPPANGVVDPGENVTVNLRLRNNGTDTTNNLVATLQPNANVLAPSGPQNYGAIPIGGSAGRDFSFTAAGNCGDLITLTLQLQDGANNLGTVTYTLRLGTPTSVSTFNEAFDGVTAPALPAGWTSAATGFEVPWVTSTTNPASAPNDAFAPNATNIGNTELVTPSIAVPTGGAQLTFRNLYNMESGFDGMVLEISINGGAFTDITAGGNAFIAGGYNATISASFGNPIGGRMAWSGLSAGTTAAPTYITSTINLPAATAGQNVQLKWRAGTDDSVAAAGAAGVRIDSIVITGTTFVCNTACAGAPRIATSAVLSCNGSNTVATIRVTNSGTATANNVVLTTANLGSVSGTPLPQTVGSLAPGASATRTVTFSGAPSGATALQTGGTYDGGTFSSTRRVTAPACNAASLAPSVPFLPSLPAILLAAVVPPSAQTGR